MRALCRTTANGMNGENRIHMVDEAVPVKDLIENAKLVADGIMALCCK